MTSYILAAFACMCILHSGHTQNTPAVESDRGSYLILYPTSLDPDKPYNITVRLLRPVTSERVRVEMYHFDYEERSKPRKEIIGLGEMTFNKDKMEGSINVKMPKDFQKGLQLQVTSSGTLNINVTASRWIYNSYIRSRRDVSVFIQTDKRTYKTGQTVRYRVFALDRDLKPIDPHMDIIVNDPHGNKLQKYSNISNKLGFSGELPLSEAPPLGRWTINVMLAKHNTEDKNDELADASKNFVVEEYVLPKFEVSLTMPSYGLLSSPEVKGRVTAKYTYGKPVKGRVVLRVTKSYGMNYGFEPTAVQTEFEIDGEQDFSIATAVLLKFDSDLKYHSLNVLANVTETETGEIRIAKSSINFYEKSVDIQFQSRYRKDSFKPGFKYTTYLKVSQPDGRPLTSIGDRIRFRVSYITDTPSRMSSRQIAPMSPSSNLMTFISPVPGGDVIFMPDMFLGVPRDGIIELSLDIPEIAVTGHIEAELGDVKVTKNLKKYGSASKAYINLEIKSSHVKVGSQAAFMVSSNVVPRQRIVCHVFNSGQLVHTQYTYIRTAYSYHTFYMTVTADMLPHSNVVVYFYETKSKELIADGLRFTSFSELTNEVRLRYDRGQVSPGSNVTLHVQAAPESQVLILAVDKSVILQGTGNDITKSEVMRRASYGYDSSYTHSDIDWRYRNKYLPDKLHGANAKDTFEKAGIGIMSDAHMDEDVMSIMERNRNIRRSRYMGKSADLGTWADMPENTVTFSADNAQSAGGFSFAGAGQTGVMETVRKNFAETWIWANESVSSTGQLDISATLPDTVTNWVTTAYALHKDKGFGIADQSANITSYLPFFVSLHLPMSVISGEVALIQALVYNYYSFDMYVTVTLKNSSGDFVGMEVNSDGKETEIKEDVSKCVMVKSDDVVSTYFTIRPTTVGSINLEVSASSPRAKDTVIRQLTVKAPGRQEMRNQGVLISLKSQTEFKTNEPVVFPARTVPGSERIRISVIGDIFGRSMDNIDRLIVTPYGTGEENMIRFAPAVQAAKYLSVTGRLSGPLKEKVMRVMTTGYQRQLIYRRFDGSFSDFGNADKEGSVWLTAFVIKSFVQAMDFIYIDPDIIKTVVDFFKTKQQSNGSFMETDNIYKEVHTPVRLTAYILIALKEVSDIELLDAPYAQTLRETILQAWKFLSGNAQQSLDDHELAIAALALTMMSPAEGQNLLARLDSSTNIVRESDRKYWKDDIKSKEIETAAYVLLSNARLRNITAGLGVFRWLVTQRNPYGGFVSTHDTVIALQSLTEFASFVYSPDVNMTVAIEAGTDTKDVLKLEPHNMDVLQFIDLKPPIYRVSIHAKGLGTALVEVSQFYNILDDPRAPIFDLNANTNGTDVDQFTLKVCARYKASAFVNVSLVIFDVGFPSGFTPDINSLIATMDYKKKQLIDGRLILYFNKMGTELVCVTVNAKRDVVVARVRPASVRVYSADNQDESAMTLYLPNTLKKSGVCDVCGKECGCVFDPEAVPKETCITGSRTPIASLRTLIHGWQPNLLRRMPVRSRSRTVRFQPTMRQTVPFRRTNLPRTFPVRRNAAVNRG